MMNHPGPRFSEAARVAAAAKRRERSRLAAETFNEPVVFALRAPVPEQGYIWEIRKFGGISIERAERCYETATAARQAGIELLRSRGASVRTADPVERIECLNEAE